MSLKKVADKVKNHQPRRRQSKSNRTLSLAEPQFRTFMEYCRSKGIAASDVVDDLIGEFLHEVADDLPPESFVDKEAC